MSKKGGSKVVGPNAPKISPKLKGGNNNRFQTPGTVEKESYRKARGGGK